MPQQGYQMRRGGRGWGGGRGRGRGRGRARGSRWISTIPQTTFFKPIGVEHKEENVVVLTLEELEAVKLVDYEGLLQEEAALQMGVSRKTLWNDLKSGRKKIASALIKGYGIRIEGGNYILREEISD